jgi:spore coat polysaccharide biosynthesis predicted glycosyltransferase SpsG
MRPKVLLVPDCGERVGSGHLDRAVALAEALKSTAEVTLVLPRDEVAVRRARERVPNIEIGNEDLVARAEETVESVAPDAVVLDGYRFDRGLQGRLRGRAFVVLIDDLSAECDVDLLVNPAPGGERLAPPTGARRVLAGGRYAIMSAVYLQARARRAGGRRPGRERLLVVSGAADVGGIMSNVVDALAPALARAEVDAVIGPGAKSIDVPPGVTLHQAPPDLASLMAAASIYVGAAGTTAVQAAAVGVPMVICPVVQNQVDQARALEDAGAALLVMPHDGAAPIAVAATALLSQPARLREMSRSGAAAIDGQGAGRVAAEVVQLTAIGRRT